MRDVTLGEDASRIRTGHGAQNMATLRSITMNFMRRTGSSIADARRRLALAPHTAPLDLFGIPRNLRITTEIRLCISSAIRDELVTVQAATTTGRAKCTACGTTSTRVHSRYVRRLDDTAAASAVWSSSCSSDGFRRQQAYPQAAFVEQEPGPTFRHGRRSQGLQTALKQVPPSFSRTIPAPGWRTRSQPR